FRNSLDGLAAWMERISELRHWCAALIDFGDALSWSLRRSVQFAWLLRKHGLAGRAEVREILLHAGGDRRDVRDLARAQTERIRRAGSALLGGRDLGGARRGEGHQRSAENQRTDCDAKSGLEVHGSLLLLTGLVDSCLSVVHSMPALCEPRCA